MKYVWAVGSHVGMHRQRNEDSLYPEQDGSSNQGFSAAVADGMGGLPAGDIASQTAIKAVSQATGKPAERVQAANRALLEAIAADYSLNGMGTTLTLAEFNVDGLLTVGHVGDSRAYMLRDGEIAQVTEDHTWVNLEIRAGRLTEEEARTHPNRSVLMQGLGFEPHVEVDTHQHQLADGDRILLCTDGLNGMVRDPEIGQILGSGSEPEAAWNLIDAANQAGGHDNITVVVISVNQ